MSVPPKTKFIEKPDAIPSAVPMQAHTFHMGRILLEMGKITPEDTERILQLQKQNGILFGEAARQLGLISDIDIQQVLAYQFEHPYLLPEQQKYSPELMVAYQPFCAQVESMRAVRSQLIMRWFSTDKKSITVVSLNSGCGSSAFVANLSVLFSQLGQRTLLVDANLRHPAQHDIFNLQSKQGLSDVLAGRVELSNVTSRLEPFVDLTVLTAGTLPPNPSELLSRGAFIDAHKHFVSQYDIVLYDTPEFISSTDALLIAARTEGVLLIIHKNKTRFADINAINDEINSNGIKLIGTVLIDL